MFDFRVWKNALWRWNTLLSLIQICSFSFACWDLCHRANRGKIWNLTEKQNNSKQSELQWVPPTDPPPPLLRCNKAQFWIPAAHKDACYPPPSRTLQLSSGHRATTKSALNIKFARVKTRVRNQQTGSTSALLHMRLWKWQASKLATVTNVTGVKTTCNSPKVLRF